MVFTVEEILEKSRQHAIGVEFDDALKATSKKLWKLFFFKLVSFSFDRVWEVPLLSHLHLGSLYGECIFRNDGSELCFASCGM